MSETHVFPTEFLFLASGLMFLYYGARGIFPRGYHDAWDPKDRGKPMDKRRRIVFLVAGLAFCCAGVFLYFRA
jgi:hypothetical protein